MHRNDLFAPNYLPQFPQQKWVRSAELSRRANSTFDASQQLFIPKRYSHFPQFLFEFTIITIHFSVPSWEFLFEFTIQYNHHNFFCVCPAHIQDPLHHNPQILFHPIHPGETKHKSYLNGFKPPRKDIRGVQQQPSLSTWENRPLLLDPNPMHWGKRCKEILRNGLPLICFGRFAFFFYVQR